MSNNEVANAFLSFSIKRLQVSERDILRCADQLTEAQMWARGGDHENSIANLLLHLEGNMRQWILHGIAGQPDVRQRDEEFALAPTITAAEAKTKFSATLAESCAVIAAVSPERLIEVIDPQPKGTWRHLPILEAIYQVVGHVQQHMAQIVVLTKQQLHRDLDLTMPRKR